jgi:O-antigen/teichoic acid export membrane protein
MTDLPERWLGTRRGGSSRIESSGWSPLADEPEQSTAPSLPAVVRAMSWVGAGHVVGQAFWFGSLILLAALLPPRAFGTVTVGLLVVTAATRLMDSGTRGSIILEQKLTADQLRTSLALNVVVGIALTVGVLFLARPMMDIFAKGGDPLVLQVLGLSIILYAPAIVPLALLEKTFSFKRRAAVQAGATVTASVLSIVLGVLGAGVWALVLRQLVFQGLLALLGWVAARRLLPRRERGFRLRLARRHGRTGSFLIFSLTDFVVFNTDYLIVGKLTDAARLGLYSLAFTIAFAPVKQFSLQIGNVLFPAAAASDAETIRRRTMKGVRLTSLVLFPLIPLAITLAPVLVPLVLGDKWRGMVAPFQILIVVGAAHGVINVIGESLSGTGNIGFRAWVNAAWMVGMLGALLLFVHLDGIRGAALAHLSLYLPVCVAYGVWGMRRLGLDARRLAASLRGVALPALVQVATTVAVLGGFAVAGVGGTIRDPLGAAFGLAAGILALTAGDRHPLSEARAFVTAGRRLAS